MQVFPLKLQYQRVLRNFFKNKGVYAYEFHLMSYFIVRSTLWAIKHKVIAIEIYLYLWSFLEFWHNILGKLDVIEKNGFDIRVEQEKKLSE